MSYTYYAVLVLGVKITPEAYTETKEVKLCTHPSENQKFCSECGRPKEERVVVVLDVKTGWDKYGVVANTRNNRICLEAYDTDLGVFEVSGKHYFGFQWMGDDQIQMSQLQKREADVVLALSELGLKGTPSLHLILE